MPPPDARATDPGRPRSGSLGFDVRRLGEVTSTNDEVVALARAGAPAGVVIVADHQTAGRGRRGRTWESPAGASLLVSVLLRPDAPGLVTLAAGLAVVDACSSAAGVAVGLKWPNDVVVAGQGKLAGLLAEAVGDAVVVGLGLNLAWPDGAALPEGACALAGVAGQPLERDLVLGDWLGALDRRLEQPAAGLLDDYRSACTTIGRRVLVTLPTTTVEGVAHGVDEHGHLLVDGQAVSVGDVVHLR